MRTPAGPRTTAVFAAVAGLLAVAPPAASQPVNAEYQELVTRYARGERALAVGGLARFSDAELGRIAQAVEAEALAAERSKANERSKARERGKAAEPLIPLRAAVMLHLDLDEAERPEALGTEQPRRCPGRQAAIAARYASLLAWHEETKGFARRFFVALAHSCQWDACLLEAQHWAREGLKLFPRDARLLLAVGSALEESATVWAGGSTVENPAVPPRFREAAHAAAGERVARYRQARSFFEDAIASDDGLTLARVRLGRVRWRLGEREAGQAALENAAERSADPQLSYLAHLFLGRVHEDSGRLQQAVEHYRLSLSLDPSAQAAAVALSHALRRAGEVEEAREVLRRALAHAGRRAGRDAYRDYLVGDAVHFRDELAALRQESLQ
jgi:tetratricopeptide (TPR) repeat protein